MATSSLRARNPRRLLADGTREACEYGIVRAWSCGERRAECTVSLFATLTDSLYLTDPSAVPPDTPSVPSIDAAQAPAALSSRARTLDARDNSVHAMQDPADLTDYSPGPLTPTSSQVLEWLWEDAKDEMRVGSEET